MNNRFEIFYAQAVEMAAWAFFFAPLAGSLLACINGSSPALPVSDFYIHYPTIRIYDN